MSVAVHRLVTQLLHMALVTFPSPNPMQTIKGVYYIGSLFAVAAAAAAVEYDSTQLHGDASRDESLID